MDAAKNNSANTPAAADTSLHFLDYWRIIRVRKTVILTVFMLVVLTTTLVTQYLPQYYSSTARIEVEKDMPDVEGWYQGRQTPSFHDPYWLTTQFEIIQSGAILHRVIKKLRLNERFAERDKLPVPYRLDETMILLKRDVDITTYRNTSIIEIKVFSPKPEEAAEIANEIANAYKEYRQETRMEVARSGVKTLQDEYAEKEKEYQKSMDEVKRLREELQVYDIDPYSGRVLGTLEQETLRRLEAIQIEAHADFVQMEKLYSSLTNLSRAEFKRAIQTANPDQHLAVLMEELARAEHKRSLLEPDYSADHPEMLRVNKLIETLERQVNDRLDGIIKGLETRVISYKARAQELTAKVEDAKKKERLAAEKMQPYLAAKDKFELDRQLMSTLKLRVSSATLDNLKIGYSSTVKMVDVAEPGLRPERPKKILNITLGVIAGLILGVGLAFFIEYLDTSVKTIDDVERALQAPVLGVIPQHVSNLLDEGPESPHAEAYRVLRTNLLFSRKDDKWNTLTIVSAGAGEGKSTTLFNLAVVFAQNAARVLIVDSDLRRPSLHRILKVSNSIGLTNYLLKQNTLEEVIQTTSIPTLDFMPSGKLPSSALGILNSAAMRDMITELKNRYEYVFFDSPPIMGISDASILASEVDMTLQVIQYRRYPQPMTIRAKQMIEKVGGNLMGIVLNNINMSQDSYYYYYSGYFEESYYQQDGEKKSKSRSGGKSRETEVASTGGEIKQKY